MSDNKDLKDRLSGVLPSSRILENTPMSRHTSFQIGGAADILVFPASVDDVRAVFAAVREFGISYTVLGNGSNVLVSDKGIRGLVIKFDKAMSYLRVSGQTIVAGAGTLLKDVAEFAAANELTGLEFAVGIPGSIGGAVFMNAGAYDGEMSNVVSLVKAVDPQGDLVEHGRSGLDFGYRHSVFQDNAQVICEVTVELRRGSHRAIVEKMDDFTRRRESKQPLDVPSAGSTFKRPVGYFAGTLIEQAGLKGFSVGGAQVSEKHAGFVVNSGGATACDVLALIEQVRQRVREKHGVTLQPEVRLIGEQ